MCILYLFDTQCQHSPIKSPLKYHFLLYKDAPNFPGLRLSLLCAPRPLDSALIEHVP